MNVKIGTKAVQFPEKEYINGIFFAVRKNFKKISQSLSSPLLNTIERYIMKEDLKDISIIVVISIEYC
jgi:hypothetical protein